MATVTGTNRGDFLLGSTTRNGRIGDDTILGLGGDDFLYGFGGDDLLMGGAGDDSYMFGVGDGTDIITDLEGVSTIYFNSTSRGSFAELTSSNFSISDSGSDLVISVTVGESSQQVTLTDYYRSPSSFTILYNTAYKGSFTEVSLETIPVWQDGSERNPFLATADADTFVGSTGFDWVSYEGSTARVVIDLSTSPADASRSWATDDTLTDINNLIGSDYSDELTGNSAGNTLRGGAGNDILTGGAGSDRLYGGAGNDILAGGAGHNVLYGGAGADTLESGVGYNVLYGGDGADTLQSSGGGGYNVFYGGAGADTIEGRGGIDVAHYGGSSVGVRIDLSLTEQIDFDGTHGFVANNNEAVGDILTSMDMVYGSNHNDWLASGGASRSGLYGNDGDDRLDGGAGYDELYGGAGADRLAGGAGYDQLSGNDGNDRLYGGAGNDYLRGGRGNDHIDGGAGADDYRFFLGDGTDTIEDRAGDSMNLRFRNSLYEAADFVEASDNFNRDGNNLVITIDKDSDDGITDKITILDAYDSDSNTGIGNAAFTINIEYLGGEFRAPITEITDAFWHYLA